MYQSGGVSIASLRFTECKQFCWTHELKLQIWGLGTVNTFFRTGFLVARCHVGAVHDPRKTTYQNATRQGNDQPQFSGIAQLSAHQCIRAHKPGHLRGWAPCRLGATHGVSTT